MKMMMNVTQDDGHQFVVEIPQKVISSQEIAKFLVNSLISKNILKDEFAKEALDLIEEKINVRIALANEPSQVHYVALVGNFIE